MLHDDPVRGCAVRTHMRQSQQIMPSHSPTMRTPATISLDASGHEVASSRVNPVLSGAYGEVAGA